MTRGLHVARAERDCKGVRDEGGWEEGRQGGGEAEECRAPGGREGGRGSNEAKRDGGTREQAGIPNAPPGAVSILLLRLA